MLDGPEECEDAVPGSADGCEPDCTFTCTTNADCDDADMCTGSEICDAGRHACLTIGVPGPSGCEVCDPATGPFAPDGDGDGEDCDTDCDDTDPNVGHAIPEICDGIDNDCDGATDESGDLTPCYPDLDRDGWPAMRPMVSSACGCPPDTAPARVGAGGAVRWDCFDAPSPVAADVHPFQLRYFDTPYTDGSGLMSFDWNCDDTAEKRYTTVLDCPLLSRLSCRGEGWASATGAPDCGAVGEWASCQVSVLLLLCEEASLGTRVQSCR
jgi:hypothetical protein